VLSAHSNYVVRFLNEDNEPEPVLANCVMRDNTCETITWSLTIMRSDGDDDDKVRAGDDLSYTFNDEKADDARSNHQYDYSNHLMDGVSHASSINRKTNGNNNNNNNSPKEQPILITPTKPKGKSNHLSYLYYNKELDCTKVINDWKNDFRDVWEMKCQVPNISPKTPNISPSLDSPAVLSYSPQLNANTIPVAISSLSPSSLRIDGSYNNNMLEFKLDSPPLSSSRRLDESSHSRQHMIYDGKSKALSDSKYCGGNDRENITDGDDSGL
jgi:hypothetical protein